MSAQSLSARTGDGDRTSRDAFAQYAEDVPRGPFGSNATAEEVTAGIDLTGKTALVTGCNAGIGYETMRVLAMRGAHVLGTARSVEKGEVACNSVAGRCTPLVLELTDFDSVGAGQSSSNETATLLLGSNFHQDLTDKAAHWSGLRRHQAAAKYPTRMIFRLLG